MLLKNGNTAQIQDPKWFILELRSERTLSPSLKRLGNLILSTFGDIPVEVFIPVQKRDHENFELSSDCYVFVHSDDFEAVKTLKSVVGVASLLTLEGTRTPLKVDDTYVRGLIQEAQEAHQAAAKAITQGAFVRILDGPHRDYCGYVTDLFPPDCVVLVVLKGRSALIDTPVGNLLDMSHIPEDQRVYYYCPAVAEYLSDGGQEALDAISPDLTATPSATTVPEFHYVKAKKHRSRHETVTAFIRRYTQERLDKGEEINMLALLGATLEAVHLDHIRKPKTAHIIYSIIKRNMVDFVYKDDPGIKSFRDVVKRTKCPISLKLITQEARKLGILFPGDPQ